MAKEYSLKCLDKAKKISCEKVDTNPLFMPVGFTRPETLNEAMNRILSHSAGQGMSLEQAYNSIAGEFDVDDDDTPNFDGHFPLMEQDDDGFEQSPFASYDVEPTTDFRVSEAKVSENKPQEVATAPAVAPSPEPEQSEGSPKSEQAH